MTSNKGILIIGATPQGLQAALTLAHLGRKVTLIDRDSEIDKPPKHWSDKGKRWHRYLITQSSYHPLIELRTETEVRTLEHGKDGARVELLQRPQWVLPELCVDCKKCLPACPVDFSSGRKPLFQVAVPTSMAIEKRNKAPCRLACPIDMNPQGYVALIAQERFEEANDLIRDKNPLPRICGRICHHPCETECRRQEIDEPIAICALKRFAAEEAKKKPKNTSEPNASLPRGPRVAIIGSGPAGLTAAHDLAKAGFRPTIMEAEAQPGGLMRQAIAPFRLPREILEAEIAEILDLGIDLRLNAPIHSLKELKKLKAQGFKAILLATGASRDLPLNIPGEDLKQVYGCVSFLKNLWNGLRPSPLGRLVVIGGGNAAVEAARAAVRSGAKAVSLVCLEKRGEMPAWDFEIDAALKEGVKIINGLGPKQFVNKGRRLSAIEFKRCTAVFDKKGAFNPQYDETMLTTIEAETAIVAIGQTPGISPLIQKEADPSLRDKRNLKRADSDQIEIAKNGETHIPGIYASGDMVSGPSTVVEAMASGRRGAQMIIHALKPGEGAVLEDEPESPPGEYPPIPEGMPKQKRRPLPHRTVSERIKDNDEVVGPFSVKEALKEASRCLQCGVCSECLRCQDACELGAIRHDRTWTLKSLYFDRIIVADRPQMDTRPESSRLVTMPNFGKTASWAKAMLAGRVAAMDALSESPIVKLQPPPRVALGDGDMRIGVFLCSCNGTLTENGQMERMISPVKKAASVAHVEVLLSACHPEKGLRIEEAIRDKALNGALIASCTCCHLDFVCESCNDQRIRLKHRLFRERGFDPKDVALINIKETCMLPFKDHPERGMALAFGLIRSGLWQLGEHKEVSLRKEETRPQAVILGATEAGLAAAKGLRQQISSVSVVDDRKVEKKIRLELQEYGIDIICPVRPVRLEGQQGEFTLILENTASEVNPSYQNMAAGIVILGRNEFKSIPYRRDLFVRALHKSIPRAFGTLETRIPGVYMASWSQVRKVPEEILGKAAASEGLGGIFRNGHSFDDLVAYVDPQLCRGCSRCADICPEGAAHLEEISRGVGASWIDPQVCTRCGNCLAECPTGAIGMPESDQEYFEKVINVFL